MFNEIKKALTHFISATFSNPKEKGAGNVHIRSIQSKKGIQYQVTTQLGPKAIHHNLKGDLWDFIELTLKDYKQAIIQTQTADFHVLVNRKGDSTVLKKAASKMEVAAHNRAKQYLIPEGTPVPYLIKLGVMNAEGKVFAKMYDKFRQINRFLEFIRDVLPALSKEHRLRIIDFGCGKAYLTFALYHYLTDISGYEVDIHGLDLKQDVVDHCQSLANEFGYKNLSFSVGDIKGYKPEGKVDFVVTLHACDTATDAALYQAVKWGADVILSVPCCQHELYDQIRNDDLDPIMRHGILRERFASLATDAARVEALEAVGYKTQIMEFIDMAHTPKNLLIRAIKGKGPSEEALKRYLSWKEFLGISPAIDRIVSK